MGAAALAVVAVAPCSAGAHAKSAARCAVTPAPVAGSPDLQLAERGLAAARRRWRDTAHHWRGETRCAMRMGWYDAVAGDRRAYPLVTIWDAVPLFETLDAVQIAAPSAAHAAAVDAFAAVAEQYFDRYLRPVPGYAPYPGDRAGAIAWFDDNGWWGLAFMDAYRATHEARYVIDAQRAFAYIARLAWDPAGGGLWWNTSHPYKSGEVLATATLLGAQLYQQTHAATYLNQVMSYLSWADANFVDAQSGLYVRSDTDPTPMPYVEGPMVEAHQVLCDSGNPVIAGRSACAWATLLAHRSMQRFADRLNMGPQFDAIYLHWMLTYAKATGDDYQAWLRLATEMAQQAQSHVAAGGLYPTAWDGSPITQHQARPNMLQTDAATLELFAWLGTVGQ